MNFYGKSDHSKYLDKADPTATDSWSTAFVLVPVVSVGFSYLKAQCAAFNRGEI